MNIRDIAKMAGVSSATVSRVINKSGYVKQQTKENIEDLICAYNYTPSAVARSLSKQDSASIGVIFPDIENTFFAKVIRRISVLAEHNNYNILYCDTNENTSTEHRFLRTAKEQRLKGLIITPTSNLDNITKQYLIDLQNSGVPVVLIDRDLQNSNFDGVFVDNFQGAYDATEVFCKLNHTRIAIIAGPETSKPGRERLKGYLAAMSTHNNKICEDYIARGDFKVAMGYDLTAKLLSMEEPPTAIFSSNNLMTMGCLKYLVEHNLVIGKDIAMIGFDDIDFLEFVGFRLSVVERAVSEMATAAMEILQNRLNEPSGNKDVYRVVFPTKVVLRGSEGAMIQKESQKLH